MDNRGITYGNKELEQMFHSLFEHNPISIALVDRYGYFRRINNVTSDITGYTPAQLINKRFYRFINKNDLRQTLSSVKRALLGEPQHFETAFIHKEGYRVDLETNVVPIVVGEETTGVILMSQDITERKRTVERVRHMAYYDDMTGLPNRRMFTDLLTEQLASMENEGERIAVFFMDIDRYKLVNDSFGHEVGDMLLLQVAERLTHCVTERDMVARMEGDEFAFYFSGLSTMADVERKAKQLLDSFEQPFMLQNYPLYVTASVGISIQTHGQGDNNAQLLFRQANLALSKAKEQGKNNYQMFAPAMNGTPLERLKMETELRRALRRDEFMLVYQPQVNLKTGSIVGAEALIRWNHPDRGIVSPAEFIPLAEECGLIVPIGEWALRQACRQNKAWQEAGFPHFPISVNLSMRQFQLQNLTGVVAQVLEETGLNARYLELEITESMTMDVHHASESLRELTELGVGISIDDFGTGYSSFHYLKNFPINNLKIDRSFVRDISNDPNDAAIVAAIIAMAHKLRLHVVAEGVETEEQYSFLRSHKCDNMQGYYYSPPVSSEKLEGLLERSREDCSTFQEQLTLHNDSHYYI